jgi:hypothetical protein
MTQHITLEDFKKRIVTLLLRSGLTDLPKSMQDRQILFKSAVLKMKAGEQMSESEVNEKLSSWLHNMTTLKTYDHVALRRALVDHGYLERSSDGAAYQLSLGGPRSWSFDSAVDDIDLESLLEEARQEIEARKQAFLAKKGKEKKG